MLAALSMVLVGSVSCSSRDNRASADSTASIAAHSDTLVRFGIEDQAERDSFGEAAARNDTAYMARMMRGDSARTNWLKAFVAAHGWPRKAVYGDSASKAAFLIVQHSPDFAFQAQMLPMLEQAAAASDVRAQDVAMLSDRVAVHHGKPQRYGTQFSLRGNTMVADSIADLPSLDSLRASVGLPPMNEYVKVLSDVYKLPVQWPPPRR